MKRKIKDIDETESRLSNLLFNKSKDLVDKLQNEERFELDADNKPAWVDEDDTNFRADIIPNTKDKCAYTEKLKQKYETLIGTPSWAQLGKKVKKEENEDIEERPSDDSILRSVGHLQKRNFNHLPKDYLEINIFPRINAETGNEGPVIKCVKFHPKISAALVAGQSGVVSLFTIGGDVNNKLHSFKIKNFKVSAAHFSPDGAVAYIASKVSHNYCVYDLAKAEPKYMQLPQKVKRPQVFELSPDGKYIAAAIGYDEVYLIAADSRELMRSLKHNNTVESVTFSHDSQQLYSYCVQGEIVIWDLSTFRVVKKFQDNGCVTASKITCSPCGRLLATGSGEGIVNIYDISNISNYEPVPLKTIPNLTTKITDIKFNPSSEILAMSSGYYPNAVKLVHIPSYHVFANFPKQSTNLNQVDVVDFSPNSGFMALGNNKGKALLYRLKYYKNY